MEDRALAHLRIVVMNKLRRGEPKRESAALRVDCVDELLEEPRHPLGIPIGDPRREITPRARSR